MGNGTEFCTFFVGKGVRMSNGSNLGMVTLLLAPPYSGVGAVVDFTVEHCDCTEIHVRDPREWDQCRPRIERMDSHVVIVGYPRTSEQARKVVTDLSCLGRQRLVHLLELLAPEDDCLRRLAGRCLSPPERSLGEQRVKHYFKQIGGVVEVLRASPRIVSHKPVRTDHADLHVRCRNLIGLPAKSVGRSPVSVA